MENTLNTGSLETLTPGNSLLVSSRKVANGKIQLEVAEKLENSASNNPLGSFNKSDDRFSSSGARRAWLTAEIEDASELLGLDLSTGYTVNDKGHEVLMLNVLNPTVLGQALRVQVTETVEPSEYQATNLDSAAKRKGKDGDFITNDGMYIFANTDVVFGEPTHTFLQPDTTSTTSGNGIMAANNVFVETGEIIS